MSLVRDFLEALAVLMNSVLGIYMWLFIIRALLSWVNPDPYNPIVVFLNRVTEPVLYRIRKRLPMYRMGGAGIDLSPLIAILLIMFLQVFLSKGLISLGKMIAPTLRELKDKEAIKLLLKNKGG